MGDRSADPGMTGSWCGDFADDHGLDVALPACGVGGHVGAGVENRTALELAHRQNLVVFPTESKVPGLGLSRLIHRAPGGDSIGDPEQVVVKRCRVCSAVNHSHDIRTLMPIRKARRAAAGSEWGVRDMRGISASWDGGEQSGARRDEGKEQEIGFID